MEEEVPLSSFSTSTSTSSNTYTTSSPIITSLATTLTPATGITPGVAPLHQHARYLEDASPIPADIGTMTEAQSAAATDRTRQQDKATILPYLSITLVPSNETIIVALDTLSSSSFIHEKACKHFSFMKTSRQRVALETLHGTKVVPMKAVKFEMEAATLQGKPITIPFECFVTSNLTNQWHPFDEKMIPFLPSDIQKEMNILPSLHDKNKQIDLIVGQGELSYFLKEILQVPKIPTLQLYKSPFGWTCAGQIRPKDFDRLSSFSRKADRNEICNSAALALFCTPPKPPQKCVANLTGTEQLALIFSEYWKCESYFMDDEQQFTMAEITALKEVKASMVYDSTIKRYTAKYPFLTTPIFRNNSRTIRQKYDELERKLKRPGQETYTLQYVEYMDKFIADGKAEALTDEEVACISAQQYGSFFFVPHFPVQRDDSKTTPSRPVYNFSFRAPKGMTSEGKEVPARSLNDVMLPGPSLVPKIFKSHLQFRRHAVAFTCDISRMFHCVNLQRDQQDLCLFYWRPGGPDSGQPIRVYRTTVLSFGTKASPFVAELCLFENAERVAKRENTPRMTAASKCLRENSYVDDVTVSVPTVRQAQELIHDLRKINDEASFSLRKFASNSSILMESIPEDLRGEGSTVNFTPDSDQLWFVSQGQKPLGLVWDCEKDAFNFKAPDTLDLELEGKTITRRLMSKIVSTVSFDTLGYRCGFLIEGRFHIQKSFENSKVQNPPKNTTPAQAPRFHTQKSFEEEKATTQNTPKNKTNDWDDPVDPELAHAFKQWVKLIPQLNECFLSRYLPIDPTDTAINQKIYLTSDGGERGFCATAHLRWFDVEKGEWDTKLIAARAHARHLAKLNSIPRTELAGLLLATKLAKELQECYKLEVEDFVIMVDSEICYHWARTSEILNLGVFVGVRAAKIKASRYEIRLLPGTDNPSDLGTKLGTTPSDLKGDLWQKGPSFLVTCDGPCTCKKKCSKPWPKIPAKKLSEFSQEQQDIITKEFVKEARVIAMGINTLPVERNSPVVALLECSHNFEKQQLRLAHWLKFLYKCGKKAGIPRFQNRDTSLYPLMQRAFRIFVNTTQRLHFPQEWKDLSSGKEEVHKGSNLKQYSPFLDTRDGPTDCTCKVSCLTAVPQSKKDLEANKPIRNRHGKILMAHSENAVALKDCPTRGIPVLRQNSRLKNEDLSYSFKYPIILPSRALLTLNIILYKHARYCHPVRSFLINDLQQELTILRIVSTVKLVTRKCKKCQSLNVRKGAQRMAPLPISRTEISEDLRPLGNLILDGIGPFETRSRDFPRSKTTKKKWILCLSCMASRYVVLRVLHDLSTASVLEALQSIQNTYAPLVHSIFSDLGSNFVGASKPFELFMKNHQKELHDKAALLDMRWKFNVVSAPHRAGAAERLVGLTKRSLKLTFGRGVVYDRDLEATLEQVQAFLNNRPLTAVNSDVHDSRHLTPSMLVFGANAHSRCQTMGDLPNLSKKAQSIFELRESYFKSFVKTYQNLYLPLLRDRKKWQQKKENLKLDQTVMVDLGRGQKRHLFPLGRIVGLPEGKLHRTYQVQMATPTPIAKRGNRVHWEYFPVKSQPVSIAVQNLLPLELDVEEGFVKNHKDCLLQASSMLIKSLPISPFSIRPESALAFSNTNTYMRR